MKLIQLSPDDDLLNILSDPVFKAVFTHGTDDSRGALKDLISAYTGSPVASVSVKQNEPAVDGTGERQIRFDVNVKFNDGKLADIEMTMNALDFDLIRGEYYLDKLHTGQSIQGVDRDYSDLKETWQISFLNNRMFFNDGAMIHRFEYYDKDNRVSLGGLTRMVTVELDKAEGLKDTERLGKAEKWAYTFKFCPDEGKRDVINRILKSEEGISMAMATLLTISKDENERARLLTQEKNLTDWQSGIVHARREGLKIGQQQGIQIGQKGIKVEAQNLLNQGMTPEQVLAHLLGK
jgi:predicted transposase/invertase (TIGR01784 family)